MVSSVPLMGNVHVNMVMVVLGATNVNLTFIVHQLAKNVQVFCLSIITLISVQSFDFTNQEEGAPVLRRGVIGISEKNLIVTKFIYIFTIYVGIIT